MNTSVEVLIRLLEQTQRVTVKLGDVTTRKRKMLVRLHLDELEILAKEEEGLLSALVDLDQERIAVAAEAAGSLRLNPDAKVLEIAEAAGEPARSKLIELRTKLTVSAEQLARSTRMTARLAEKSVNFFGQMVRKLAVAGRAKPTYTPYGISAHQNRRFVDQTA